MNNGLFKKVQISFLDKKETDRRQKSERET